MNTVVLLNFKTREPEDSEGVSKTQKGQSVNKSSVNTTE